jgi:hypothetical protein
MTAKTELDPNASYGSSTSVLKEDRRQIPTMKPRYESILNWLIDNPTAPLRDAAEYFGVTSQWMRIVVNSNAFRARLEHRQDEVFHTCVADLRDKTHAAAHEALDRLMSKINTIEDPMKLLKAVDTLFDKLGYTGKANVASPANYTQHNTTVVVSGDALGQARAIMDQALALRTPRETEGGTSLSNLSDDSSPSLPEAEGRGPLSKE